MNVLTISGDRQDDKSYTLGLLAIDAAINGQSVFYVCDSRKTEAERFREVLTKGRRLSLSQRACVAHGDQWIELYNGAKIYFGIPSDRGWRDIKFRLFDNVPEHPDFYIGAERVIRTELIGDDE